MTTPTSVFFASPILHDGAQIALEIAAGNAETGAEIGALPDPLVELQRWCDIGPVGADVFANLGEVLATVIEATRQKLMLILASSALS